MHTICKKKLKNLIDWETVQIIEYENGWYEKIIENIKIDEEIKSKDIILMGTLNYLAEHWVKSTIWILEEYIKRIR